MDKQILPETKIERAEQDKIPTGEFAETSLEMQPETGESMEKQRDQDEMEKVRTEQYFKASSTPSDDSQQTQAPSPVDDFLSSIPGKTPEEKILHILNDFPTNKAKDVVDSLKDPAHFGEPIKGDI